MIYKLKMLPHLVYDESYQCYYYSCHNIRLIKIKDITNNIIMYFIGLNTDTMLKISKQSFRELFYHIIREKDIIKKKHLLYSYKNTRIIIDNGEVYTDSIKYVDKNLII